MLEPIQISDDLRLYPPSAALIDDGVPPREAAQWSAQDTDHGARPIDLTEAIELAGEELRLDIVKDHLTAIQLANDLSSFHLEKLGYDVDGHADETVITLVALGQFVEQATHDLSRAPVGAELV